MDDQMSFCRTTNFTAVALSSWTAVQTPDVHVTQTLSCNITPPRDCVWILVTRRTMPWVREGGGGVRGRGRDGRWLWHHYPTMTRAQKSVHTGWHTPYTQLFFLLVRDWIILILVWEKVSVSNHSSAVHVLIERGFLFEVSNSLTYPTCFSHSYNIGLWSIYKGKSVCLQSGFYRYNTFVFTKFIGGPHLLRRFRGFVIHLPAVASVYVSMLIRCVHMLSGAVLYLAVELCPTWCLFHVIWHGKWNPRTISLGMTWNCVHSKYCF